MLGTHLETLSAQQAFRVGHGPFAACTDLAKLGLIVCAAAEKPVPWWRALRRLGTERAPKRYARAAGALGPVAGLFITRGDGLDKPTRDVLVIGLTVILHCWWRSSGEGAIVAVWACRSFPNEASEARPGCLRGAAPGDRKVQTQCKHAPRHSTPAGKWRSAKSLAIEPNLPTTRHPTTPRNGLIMSAPVRN
jgi:hypothetical protein